MAEDERHDVWVRAQTGAQGGGRPPQVAGLPVLALHLGANALHDIVQVRVLAEDALHFAATLDAPQKLESSIGQRDESLAPTLVARRRQLPDLRVEVHLRPR